MPFDDQTEMFWWVDEMDRELGSITRAEAHSGSKKFHRAVDILVFNTKDQLLMQKRSMKKDVSPGYWTISVSGHVTYPQSYLETAVKETGEEIGLTLQPENFIEKGDLKIIYAKECEISKLYKVNLNHAVEIHFDPIEIDAVEWVDKNKLSEWIQTHPITLAAREVLSYSKLI